MELFLLIFAYVFVVPYAVELSEDPAPGLTRSVADSRKLKCRMLSRVEAINAGRFEVEEHEGNNEEKDRYVSCERSIFDPGERENRDEAILTSITEQVGGIATAAVDRFPSTQKWLVAIHYPVPAVSYKINKAVWVALKEKQANVSAYTRFSETEPFPVDESMAEKLKCDKHFSISASDTLLDVMLIDAQETQLHAGVCNKGVWQWLL